MLERTQTNKAEKENKLADPHKQTEELNEREPRSQKIDAYSQKDFAQKMSRLKSFIKELGQSASMQVKTVLIHGFQISPQVYVGVNAEIVLFEAENRIQKMIKTGKYKKNWSVCDLRILIWLVGKYCQKNGMTSEQMRQDLQGWKLINSMISGTTVQDCFYKWLSLNKYKITEFQWSQEQQNFLTHLEKKYNDDSRTKWKKISEQLFSLVTNEKKIYRHPKQCRQHFASFLDPRIKKGQWELSEDIELLKNIYITNGSKKWCRLVKVLKGRTQNAIKNRYQLIFGKQRKIKQNKGRQELDIIRDYLLEKAPDIDLTMKAEPQEQIQEKKELHQVKMQTKNTQFIEGSDCSFQGEQMHDEVNHMQTCNQLNNQPNKQASPLPSASTLPTVNFFSFRSLSSAFVPYVSREEEFANTCQLNSPRQSWKQDSKAKR